MEGSVACGISLVYRNLGARNKDYNFSFRLKTRICHAPTLVLFQLYLYLLPSLLSRHSFSRPVLPRLAASWRGLELELELRFSSRLLGTRPSLPFTLHINHSNILRNKSLPCPPPVHIRGVQDVDHVT